MSVGAGIGFGVLSGGLLFALVAGIGFLIFRKKDDG